MPIHEVHLVGVERSDPGRKEHHDEIGEDQGETDDRQGVPEESSGDFSGVAVAGHG